MKYLTPTIKGLITGIVMVLLSMSIYYYRGSFENGLQYIVYAVYVGGIVWTLSSFRNSDAETKNFKTYFSQGFKCFIMVTFIMVAFTWIFLKMNPSLGTAMGENYRADLVKKGNYTTAEIDRMVITAKQYFVVSLVSVAIFGYLVIGAIVTTITAVFFSRRDKITN
jgi:hypothetical protein